MEILLRILKQYKKRIILFILIGVILVPVLIHVIFKIHPSNNFFSAEWTAGDVLGFYGVLLGALATVCGVFLTIQYSQMQYKQDLIDRSLPFITITKMLFNVGKASVNCDISDEKIGDCPIEKYYYVIEGQNATIKPHLSERQSQLVASNGFYEAELAKGVTATVNSQLFYIPLMVENVGNGAAVSFSIGLYIPPYDKVKNPRCFSLARSLRAGEAIQIAIYSENEDSANIGDYDLCVSYYDIFGNQYEQLFQYRIYSEADGTLMTSLSLNGTQKKL